MKWVIPEKIHTPPTDGKLEILAGGGGGGNSSGNLGGRRDLNQKILPRGSLLTIYFNHSKTNFAMENLVVLKFIVFLPHML